jgi:hypothetical protein
LKSFFQKKHSLPKFSSSYGIVFLVLGLILLGLKLLLVARYGSATPYWDQWDAEAANLYKPFFEGTLTLGQLFVPHNEHRIFTTRLLVLLLLKIHGIWDPLLEMIVNAGLHVIAILSMLGMLLHAFGKKAVGPLLVFSLILFAFPYGWENTLAGFQAQFYFVLLFSVLTLFLLIEKKLFTPLWFLGVLCGILAFFSLASGIFALAAVTAVFVVHYVLGIDRSWEKVVSTLALMVLVLLGVAFTPTIAGHAPLKAHSIKQFVTVFLTIMSWPFPGNFFWFLLRNAPSLIFGSTLFLGRPLINDRRWFLLGLIIWASIQATSIAYGRAEGCLASRYLDLFAFSVLINFACLLDQEFSRNIFHKSIKIFWTAVVVIALAWYCWKNLPQQLAEKKRTSMAQTLNVQNYQRSGDIIDLKDKPFLEIPYPDPMRLAMILSSPTIQKILPTHIQKPASGISITVGRYDGVVEWLLSHALLFIAVGVMIALVFLIC